MQTRLADGRVFTLPDPRKHGALAPDVLRLALAVQRSGWRVSSALRPGFGPSGSQSHARGVAIDVCPQEWTSGGFGPATAQMFHRVARQVAPHRHWFCLAEDDHIHIQLSDRDFLGTQLSGQRNRYFDPNLKEIAMSDTSVRTALYHNVPEFNLPTEPIGDLRLTEAGDINLFPAEQGDLEDGDYEEGDYEEGDAETGARRSKKARAQRTVAKGRARGAVSRKDFTRLSKSVGPAAAQRTVRAAHEGAMNRTDWVAFEHARNAVMLQTALGPRARLRPREIAPLLNKLVDFPAVQPKVLSMAWDAANATFGIDIDVALSQQLGIAVGTVVPYLGGVVTLPVSELNKADNIQITVSRTLGTDTPLTNTLRLESKHGTPSLCFINGQIISGAPRLHTPNIAAVASTTDHNYKVTISGLTQAYNPQLRLFVPGDTETERFFSLLA